MKNAIDNAVNKFLCWVLPEDFCPDCYISFDNKKAEKGSWPTGTNLLTAEQAQVMFDHCFGDAISAEEAKPAGYCTIDESVNQLVESLCQSKGWMHAYARARVIGAIDGSPPLSAERATLIDGLRNLGYAECLDAADMLTAIEQEKPSLSAERAALLKELHKTAKEIAAAGHAGWVNVCSDAADMLAADAQRVSDLELRIRLAEGCAERCQETARFALEKLNAQQVAVPQDIREFLNGTAPLEGVWFGDDHPTEPGKFWWRKYLSTAPQPTQAERLAVPQGWKMVPIEPTIEMMFQMPASRDIAEWIEYYNAMLASVPQPPQSERVPMTDSEIRDIAEDYKLTFKHGGQEYDDFDSLGFARAIEAHHHIGGKA